MTLPTLSVAHEVRACPCCAQPFTANRHNQRFCDADCKRKFGKRLYQQRRREMVKA